MKIQFATVEALAAALVVAATISAVSAAMAYNNGNAYSSLQAMRLGFAEHDFMAQVYGNASLRDCMAMYLRNGSACVSAYESRYAEVYGIPNFTVSGAHLPFGRCFAAPVNGILCIGD